MSYVLEWVDDEGGGRSFSAEGSLDLVEARATGLVGGKTADGLGVGRWVRRAGRFLAVGSEVVAECDCGRLFLIRTS